jgi:hypothetical protein
MHTIQQAGLELYRWKSAVPLTPDFPIIDNQKELIYVQSAANRPGIHVCVKQTRPPLPKDSQQTISQLTETISPGGGQYSPRSFSSQIMKLPFLITEE